jgi:hypothetical protein
MCIIARAYQSVKRIYNNAGLMSYFYAIWMMNRVTRWCNLAKVCLVRRWHKFLTLSKAFYRLQHQFSAQYLRNAFIPGPNLVNVEGGNSTVIAGSFTDFLKRLSSSDGQMGYWDHAGFVSLGDACGGTTEDL